MCFMDLRQEAFDRVRLNVVIHIVEGKVIDDKEQKFIGCVFSADLFSFYNEQKSLTLCHRQKL